MVASHLAPDIHDFNYVYDILQALEKQLAPTDRIRHLQLAQEYSALKKAPSKLQNTER
jgi:hypothetical protein